MPEIVDDKSEHCIPFVLRHLQQGLTHRSRVSPLFIGINGIQGAGKTVLVRL
jgi:D-glycerate 3-kinase